VQQITDQALVSRILAHDEHACAEMIGAHHAVIYRLLFHLCRDQHLAEDLVQETFASAWASLEEFRGGSSLSTWLHRIAYRKFLDLQRRKSPLVGAVREMEFEQSDDANPDPLAAAMAEENSAQLYEAVSQLESDERDVVVLHYFQGLTFVQIAEVMGVPAGTLRWRNGRGLEILRRLLQKKLEYEIE